MSNTVIEFNNVGKQYTLGTIGAGTLSQDLNRWWASIRGKEDPYLKIGESNDRTQKSNSHFVQKYCAGTIFSSPHEILIR